MPIHYNIQKDGLYQEGLMTGMEKGMEKGEKNGVEKGRVEQLLKSIQSGLRKGYSMEVIADINDITVKELKSLIKKFNLDA